MKGIIFTEFLELVEREFGLEVVDQILDLSEDEGIYTAVGSYDHRLLVKLIVNLSKTTEIPAERLQEVFGETVFINLLATLPDKAALQDCSHCFEFVRHVEEYIHVEVKKLYPDAQPPTFEFISESETELVFDYKSARCMAHVCLGLLKGCANHFEQQIDVAMRSQNEQGSDVRFTVTTA
ncbi:heme NO-binding domain-containing protein [Vibrio sp. WXL103]|uniref:heme NO-binding domain-containing protein n=1 Tax=Vibrio sp. WXL103 TaxID=3450710 RepID=UPI003EC79EBC